MATGLDREDLEMVVEAITAFAGHNLSDEKLLELDEKDEFPEAIVREMGGDGLGLQLVFIPEEYGGMGGGAFDVYRVCEGMARLDVGLATGVLATFLGSDPIVFGGTLAQKAKWLTRIAEEGILMAYAATEPQAGSDLGTLRSTAVPVEEDGKLIGYRLNGNKQWISNGGYADVYTFLAKAPEGPTWFIIERGAEGLSHGKPEDKHGIRLSNTSTVTADDVFVPVENLVGGEEGKGLLQAQLVFGYTRLMVAAFGLGAGWAAIDRAIPYSVERIQGGGPLSEKQGYTHKLIIPHIVHLEAGRAYIEETAERIDGVGEELLNTEGAIAKYLSSEAGYEAADAAIQALGGYGYTREYMVEKIKRDVRITRIYEGTSEIMEMTIARDRWQLHLKSRCTHFATLAEQARTLHRSRSDVGADTVALALDALSALFERIRLGRLSRNQHILFRMGHLVAWVEGSAALSRRAARAHQGELNPKGDHRFKPDALAAIARINAREAALKLVEMGMLFVCGTQALSATDVAQLHNELKVAEIHAAQRGLIADMDFVADVVYERQAG